MRDDASTSNEGSKKDLNKYKEIPTKKVSNIDKEFDANYDDFNVNCIAFDFKANIKDLNSTSNPVSASSADSYKFNIEEILNNSINWAKSVNITPEKAPIISKKRKAEKKKREAEKEEREVAEAIATKVVENDENIDSYIDNNK